MDESPKSRKRVVEQCQKKLLGMRQDRLNGIKVLADSLSSQITGDEADMAQALMDQNAALTQREKLLLEMREIDEALARIENGDFGYCEETEEPIETERLLAIPWTRLSLEGAEIRERHRKRFA